MARSRIFNAIPRIFCLLTFAIIFFIESTNSKPYQLLKHKDGYIAVFIRHGDEPLANIDPVLAEAFNEKNIENGVIQIEHQNINAIEERIIDTETSSETAISNITKNN